MAKKKIYRDDLVTPPGEYEDRVLKPKTAKKRTVTRCEYCRSSKVKMLTRPDLYFCTVCKRRFKKEKK